ncbi:MAG: acyloxyacyl hydrolase [Bacteroidales bacterium]|nr:acyloxyacyl hydrolase [Bacteroidales bacterium]
MKHFVFYILLLKVGLTIPFICISQDSKFSFLTLPEHITTYYHHGYLFPHHPSMAYFTAENINGFEIIASKYYPSINPDRPPEIGFGYYFSNLGDRDVYGLAHGLYMMLGGDFFKNRSKIYLQQGISFGISYNTEHFDIKENYSNRAIGSHLNTFFILSMNMKVKLGQNLLLSAGPSLVHMSNGNIKRPNFGLNLINSRVGLTWKMNPVKSSSIEFFEPLEYNKNRYLILFSGGVRHQSRLIPEYFPVGSFIAEYSRRLGLNHALGIGIDFIYDPTEGLELYVIGAHIENIIPWHGGIHLSYERIWNKLSIILQPGYKIIAPSEHYFYQFNRVGFRYKFNNNIVLNYSIKTHSFAADFIEFGVGYCFE